MQCDEMKGVRELGATMLGLRSVQQAASLYSEPCSTGKHSRFELPTFGKSQLTPHKITIKQQRIKKPRIVRFEV